MQKTAVILGSGIAGLSAGLALQRAGWQVRIFERAATLDPVGAALSLWPNALAGLDRLGVGDTVRRAGAPFGAVLIADRRGRPVLGPSAVDGTAVIIARATLQRILSGALPTDDLMLGQSVECDDSGTGDPVVRLRDGRIEQADLVIDARGLRAASDAASRVSYCGYGGVLALSDPVEGSGPSGLAAEYWGWNERFGLFEMPDNCRYWFYMRDQAADAAAPMLSEVRSRIADWPPDLARAVAATPPERLIPVAIHAKPSPRKLGRGRVIRVGDAAHAMEPNLGQGACQAIEDAVALQAIAAKYPAADILAEYERLRLKRVAMIVRRAADGRYGAHGPVATQWAMRTLLRIMPQSVTESVSRSVQSLPAYEVAARRR